MFVSYKVYIFIFYTKYYFTSKCSPFSPPLAILFFPKGNYYHNYGVQTYSLILYICYNVITKLYSQIIFNLAF